GDRDVFAVVGPLGQGHLGPLDRREQPQPPGRRARAGAVHRIARRGRRGLCRLHVHRRHPARADLRLPAERRPAGRDHGTYRRGHHRGRGSRPAPGGRLPGRRPARSRPRFPPDALCRQRPVAAADRAQRRGRRRPECHEHAGADRGFPPRGHRGTAFPPCAATARAGLRAARGAAGAQPAAPGPLRPDDAWFPRLPGGHEPGDARHRLAGGRQAAAGGGSVVAAAAAACPGGLDVFRRRAHGPSARAGAQAMSMPSRGLLSPFPKVHDVYVGKVLLGTVLLTWAVLLGLDVVIGGLMSELDDIGQGDYGFGQALLYILYTVPRRAYALVPTAAVIGTLTGRGQLATTAGLAALRALGLSRRRLGLAVAMALAVLTALMVLNGETLAPWGQRSADALKASARSPDMIVARYSGLWAREGNIFLNAGGGEERK